MRAFRFSSASVDIWVLVTRRWSSGTSRSPLAPTGPTPGSTTPRASLGDLILRRESRGPTAGAGKPLTITTSGRAVTVMAALPSGDVSCAVFPGKLWSPEASPRLPGSWRSLCQSPVVAPSCDLFFASERRHQDVLPRKDRNGVRVISPLRNLTMRTLPPSLHAALIDHLMFSVLR
ncbi:zinc finger protein 41 homolog isoform X2 [Choloepus didactylus]|uniref:zinc finger protein 41 homolog isoform X2 n=1 Tax=Choloepus didactylus TaxID=27675 RepID=UPI00189FAFF5|nr:zinc finger protein 41 homolog isoform X2 [Choloepus didactylus]